MKAIITTRKDLSADIFRRHGWDVFIYGSDYGDSSKYDIVYFRDPFNDIGVLDKTVAERAIGLFKNARSIDNVTSFDYLYELEDKFNQYKMYRDLMPATFLPYECEFVKGRHLAKKRISQRSKDIYFDCPEQLGDDWIIQELLDIKEELRVYVVFGEVIPQATIKAKVDGKVKIVGGRILNENEISLCKEIARRSNLNFIGIDLAVLNNGELKLIEVNRSPQFIRFSEIYNESVLTGILDI
ncbi:MAG: ATP-grasp domain-containing protein [Candidatus Saccharibacteria bacterium]|nr:ATP-grasp domain-containing protein [Candidatus Saccharibacteria bacterium]